MNPSVAKQSLSKKSPPKKIGIWIDRTRSFIVTIDGSRTETKIITSNMQKNVRFTGGAFKDTEEDIRDRRIRNQFNIYLNKVTSAISDAGYLYIMGPGNAKLELRKQLLKSKFHGRIAALETAGKMTERQIAARISARFSVLDRPLKTKAMVPFGII